MSDIVAIAILLSVCFVTVLTGTIALARSGADGVTVAASCGFTTLAGLMAAGSILAAT